MGFDRKDLTRRQALKALAAATSGLALNFVPRSWKTPVVSMGALPAHAQISVCPDDMCAIAVTTTTVEGGYGDFDFSMCTPNGYYIWNGSTGDGATSSQDNIGFDPPVDNETLTINTAVPGTYSIYVEQYENVPLEMTVHITTATGVHTVSFTLTENRAVADVVFPGGTVTWRSDPGFPACWGEGERSAVKGK